MSHLIENAPLVDKATVERLQKMTPKPKRRAWLEAEMTDVQHVTSLEISTGRDAALDFRLGPMSEPIRAMQACADDLVKGWGIDLQQLDGMTQPPRPTAVPQTWMRSSDYPPAMINTRRGGVVSFRLVVEPDGRPSRCLTDVEVPGPFEDAACKAVLRNARFTPALDAEGKPMRAYWMDRVNFVL